MEVKIKLDLFEGPMDLLLHLIEKSEVDIYDVPISQITDQYMNILADAKSQSLEIASEFLVMATTLLAMKSRLLLPTIAKPEDENDSVLEEWSDPREELVERLLEYKKYKILGDVLAQKEKERQQLYSRLPLDLTPYQKEQNPVENISSDDLLHIFVELLKTEKPVEPKAKVVREEISVKDRMEEIVETIQKKGRVGFLALLPVERRSREQIITTFLALLELMKWKKIVCRQLGLFDDIQIDEYRESGSFEPQVVN